MTGKKYNLAWSIHEAFSEAIGRFFIKTYLSESIEQVPTLVSQLPDSSNVRDALTQSGLLDEVYEQYNNIRQRCLEMEMGKTPKFWLMYMDIVDIQLQMHFAINLDDFDIRLKSWDRMIPYYFAMNKTHYARYGSFYCAEMKNLEETHPGAREELRNGNGISVCRNKDGIGQSIDGAGEQTFIRSSKTLGSYLFGR